MPDFGFVGAAYEAPSIYQDAQECINFYPEIDPTKAQGERGHHCAIPDPRARDRGHPAQPAGGAWYQHLIGWDASIGHLR
jgi:hypothetical protein